MIVKSDCQNRGVGGIILDYLVETAKQLGYKEISLGVDKVNIRARHLYEKKGFKTVIFDGADEHGEYAKLLKILDTDEAKEFCLLLTQKNKYAKRECERQMDSMLFERTMISDECNRLFTSKNEGLTALRDNYVLEFLDIPETHIEKELHKAIVENIRDFILEFALRFKTIRT